MLLCTGGVLFVFVGGGGLALYYSKTVFCVVRKISSRLSGLVVCGFWFYSMKCFRCSCFCCCVGVGGVLLGVWCVWCISLMLDGIQSTYTHNKFTNHQQMQCTDSLNRIKKNTQQAESQTTMAHSLSHKSQCALTHFNVKSLVSTKYVFHSTTTTRSRERMRNRQVFFFYA